MKHFKFLTGVLLACFLLGANTGFAQDEENKAALVKELQEKIEINPNDFDLHEKYLKASGFTAWGVEEDPAFIVQYEKWMKKYPKSAVLPYALGHAYSGKESPKAKPYLLKAIKLDPKMDKAYFDLWLDAERWGEFDKGSDYIRKASELAPDNPDYAFYYASGLRKDQAQYERMNLQVAERFPESERGAQALYWLAVRNPDPAMKVKYFELLREKYDPAKYGWSGSGMYSYYNMLLVKSPYKAWKIANEMVAVSSRESDKKRWEGQRKTALDILKVHNLIEKNKTGDAIAVLDTLKVHRNPEFVVLKAQAYKAGNQPQQAYETLLKEYAANPSNEMGQTLYQYGQSMNKNTAQVDREVSYIRDTGAVKATDFSLNQYFKEGKASLKDWEGKVILLTYWFPGCGPCRGEFPHFQNVVDKFMGQDLVYLGINIVQDQNDYVIPFMKSSGYTFIPLEDYEGRDKGNLDNRNAAPMNFLIDKTGRVVFKNFRTDGDSEDVLENMISALLKG